MDKAFLLLQKENEKKGDLTDLLASAGLCRAAN